MKKISFFIALLTLALTCMPAFAQPADVSIVSTVTDAISNVASASILPTALSWLGSFVALQMVITHFGLLKSGADIQEVVAKFAGSIAWVAVCIYLINNGPEFINSVGHGILTKFAPNLPGPGTIISSTLVLCSALVGGIFAIGLVHTAVAILLVNVLLVIFAIGMYMAIKVFMLSLELGLIVMLSPLSFSLLGLNALKDQGIAPLKSLLSLAYRIILLGIVYSAFSEVVNVAGNNFNAISWTNPTSWPNAVNTIMSTLCAYPVIAYLVFKSDSIAASLAGGTTNMGPGDVASAAAAGAAAGAAITSGGASLSGGAAKGPQLMGDVLKNMMRAGNGGSITNASSRGFGGQTAVGEAPARTASMSMPSTGAPLRKAPAMAAGSDLNGAPVRATIPAASENGPAPGAELVDQASAGGGAIGEAPAAPARSETGTNVATTDLSKAPTRSAHAASPGDSQSPTANFKDAPVRPNAPSAADSGRAPVRPTTKTESGMNAGIGGASTPMEQKLDQLLETMGKQGQPRNPTFGDHLDELNRHMAQEKAATHVSINAHQSH